MIYAKRGRPKTWRNPTIAVTLPKDLLRQIDEIAGAWFERRAETACQILNEGIRVEKERLTIIVRKSGAQAGEQEDWP